MKYTFFGFVLFILLIAILPQLENVRGILESSIYFWDDKRLTANEVGGVLGSLEYVNCSIHGWKLATIYF